MRPWSSLTVFNYYRVLEQARNHLTSRSPSSSKTTLSSCTGIHRGENGVSYSTMADPGDPMPLLFLDQTETRIAEKQILEV